jgi:hypothetical protein
MSVGEGVVTHSPVTSKESLKYMALEISGDL